MVPLWARFPSRVAVRLTITLSILAAAVLGLGATPSWLARGGRREGEEKREPTSCLVERG